ncbi:hypothetical protein QBZ16_005247 [Prototheca wickerhamii]|uniref:Uncharacterized protein n=1 Tax=Prototheca wickerhamii TaxID=3111 RepID=A0AAD9IH36_PROWI|nr:hypothetical protein QBZ16_005247 [Prototheca wickerhamii]
MDDEQEATGKTTKPKRQRRKRGAAQTDEAEEEDACEDAPLEDEDEDEDKARMVRGDRYYLVARKGLPLTEYGIVCARTAKMQRLSMGDASCPLPLALIDEFEAFTRRFRMDVHGAQDNNELDLEDLPTGSALELCALLGKLREDGYDLASKGKNDIWMKLIVEGERRRGNPACLAAEP